MLSVNLRHNNGEDDEDDESFRVTEAVCAVLAEDGTLAPQLHVLQLHGMVDWPDNFNDGSGTLMMSRASWAEYYGYIYRGAAEYYDSDDDVPGGSDPCQPHFLSVENGEVGDLDHNGCFQFWQLERHARSGQRAGSAQLARPPSAEAARSPLVARAPFDAARYAERKVLSVLTAKPFCRGTLDVLYPLEWASTWSMIGDEQQRLQQLSDLAQRLPLLPHALASDRGASRGACALTQQCAALLRDQLGHANALGWAERSPGGVFHVPGRALEIGCDHKDWCSMCTSTQTLIELHALGCSKEDGEACEVPTCDRLRVSRHYLACKRRMSAAVRHALGL